MIRVVSVIIYALILSTVHYGSNKLDLEHEEYYNNLTIITVLYWGSWFLGFYS